MPKLSRMGALLLVNPEQARAEIREAVRLARGNTTHAAVTLNVSHRHLCRLIDELGLARDIDAIRLELGVVVVRPGQARRPRKRAAATARK